MIKSGIEIPENWIKNGKSDLEALLTKDTLDRDPIARAHQKMSMGMKRVNWGLSSRGTKKETKIDII